MKTMLLAAAAALTLAACGQPDPAGDAGGETVASPVDGQALATAVDQAIDEKALEQAVVGTAKGAVDRAVEDAIREVVPVPSRDLQAFGAAIDEKALVEGVAGAVDTNALGEAAKRSAEQAAPAR